MPLAGRSNPGGPWRAGWRERPRRDLCHTADRAPGLRHSREPP